MHWRRRRCRPKVVRSIAPQSLHPWGTQWAPGLGCSDKGTCPPRRRKRRPGLGVGSPESGPSTMLRSWRPDRRRPAQAGCHEGRRECRQESRCHPAATECHRPADEERPVCPCRQNHRPNQANRPTPKARSMGPGRRKRPQRSPKRRRLAQEFSSPCRFCPTERKRLKIRRIFEKSLRRGGDSNSRYRFKPV